MKKNIGFLALIERFNSSRAKTYRYFNTKLSAEYPSNDFTELFNNELSNNPANTGAAELFLASAFLPEFISKIKVKKNPYIEKVVNCQLLEYQTAMNTPAVTEPKSVSLDEQEAIFESSVLDLLNNNNLTIQFSKITIDVKKIEPTDTIISIINNSEKNRITQDTIKKLSTIDTIKESLLLNDDTGDTIKESALFNDDTGDAIKKSSSFNDDTGDTIKKSSSFNDDTGDKIKETNKSTKQLPVLRDIAQAILQNEIEQARLEQFEKDMDKHTNVLESEEKVTTKGKLFHLGEKLASLTHREKLRSQETSKFRLRIGGPHIQRKNKIREPSIFSNLVYLEDYRGWRKTNAYI